jgi:hypothetical protein
MVYRIYEENYTLFEIPDEDSLSKLIYYYDPKSSRLPPIISKYFNKEHNLVIYHGIPPTDTKSLNEWLRRTQSVLIENDIDIFIVGIFSEAYHIDLCHHINNFFDKNGVNSVVVQSGIDYMNRFTNILFHPDFFRPTTDGLRDFTPISKRKYKYNCLNRLIHSREHRLMLVNELYDRNLMDDAVISCGSGETDQELEKFKERLDGYLNNDFSSSLPLKPDDVTDVIGTGSYTKKNYPGYDSVFALVVESSFDTFESEEGFQYDDTGWTRPFFTEKTSKSISCHQLPIFCSVKGYVQHMRDLGFDVFDDIIDHSYDKEEDPPKRIKMIVDEVERVTQNHIIDKIKTNPSLEERFVQNCLHLNYLYDKFLRNFKNDLSLCLLNGLENTKVKKNSFDDLL